MASRSSIYIPDRLRESLDLGGDGLSQRVNTILDRYDRIIRAQTPRLTRDEWLLILAACRGGPLWSDAGDVMPVGATAVVRYLQSLTPAERIGVIERVERFRRRADLPADEAMAAAGIMPVDAEQTTS